jgi:hypothetical protein
MPPVILEARDVIGGGRYLQDVKISTFPPHPDLPEGVRYSLCLVDLKSGEWSCYTTFIGENLTTGICTARRPPTTLWTRTRC